MKKDDPTTWRFERDSAGRIRRFGPIEASYKMEAVGFGPPIVQPFLSETERDAMAHLESAMHELARFRRRFPDGPPEV